MFSNISGNLHIKWGSFCIMYDNICALSLFLTRGPYVPLLARAGEKSPECLILLNKRVEAACQGLYGRCQSLFFFFVFPTLLLITAGSAATGKQTPMCARTGNRKSHASDSSRVHSAFVVAGSDSSLLGCIRATPSAVLPCQGWTSPAMWPSWQSALSQTMSSVRKI